MKKLQSIGIKSSANGDISTHTHDRAMLTNAAARAAVADVWNSLIYEYPAEDAPATLFYNCIVMKYHQKQKKGINRGFAKVRLTMHQQ